MRLRKRTRIEKTHRNRPSQALQQFFLAHTYRQRVPVARAVCSAHSNDPPRVRTNLTDRQYFLRAHSDRVVHGPHVTPQCAMDPIALELHFTLRLIRNPEANVANRTDCLGSIQFYQYIHFA